MPFSVGGETAFPASYFTLTTGLHAKTTLPWLPTVEAELNETALIRASVLMATKTT